MTIDAVVTGDDQALMARIARGEQPALAELYDRHGRIAFALAVRMVGESGAAEEIVQEAFLSVWRRAATYQPERAGVRGWLMTIVRNRAIDVLRARQSRPVTTPIDDLPVVAQDDPERAALASLSAAAVRAALATLSIEQRTAVELAYFAGLPYPVIAQRTGVPLGTVKSRLRLALERLRPALRTEYEAMVRC